MLARAPRRLLSSAFALALSVVACGDDGAPDAAPDPVTNAAPVAQADFAAALTKAVCDRDARCECNSAWGASQSCESAVQANVEAVMAQREGYDPACGGRLVAAYATSSCGDVPYLQTCRCALFRGNLPLGSACTKADQCASGVCYGTCYPRCPRETGESCGPYEYCKSGACKKGVCTEVGPCAGGCGPGTTCGPSGCTAVLPLGAACSAASQCESGYCPRGVCDVLPREGEPCPASRCADGLQCMPSECPEGTCAVCAPAKSCPNPYPYLN